MNQSDEPGKKLVIPSSTSKWTYVPGRVFNLPQLDLEYIKKQLTTDSIEESDEEVSESEDGDTEKDGPMDISEVLNESFCDVGEQGPQVEGAPEEDCQKTIIVPQYREPLTSYNDSLSPKLNTISEETFNFSSDAQRTFMLEDKENYADNVLPKPKQNDSFNIDLSLLSLRTPAKKVDKHMNFITPKINIIPASETKSSLSKTSLFRTIHLGKQPSSLKQPLFKTPISKPVVPTLYSTKKRQGTPFSSQCKTVVFNQHCNAGGMLENQAQVLPVMYTAPDGYDRIVVNQVEYVVINKIGRGGSSEVFSCFHFEKKFQVAIKVVSLSDSNSSEGYINEVKLLENLQQCDRIIKMFDYEIRSDQLIVVLEKGGEDLSAILKQLSVKQTHLPIYMLLFYWMEMLYAVKEIHENGVIHSDLKPANFLRVEQGLKLIDFGIASKVQEDMTCVYKSTQEGSCNYISPEALNQQKSGNANSPNSQAATYKVHFKSDVWSLGCILYQLVYRRTPFHHINQIWSKLTAITDPNHKIHFPEVDWVSPRVVNTIKMCLQYDVKSRPSVAELIEEYELLLQTI